MHKAIKFLILSDLFILGGLGLIEPIFAIFVMGNITEATITAIGIAASIQLISKAVFQIIVGKWTDGDKGTKREILSMSVGLIILCYIPFLYIYTTNLSEIFILQLLYGLGSALIYPGWMVLFTKYLTKNNVGFGWSSYSTIVSFGSAFTAYIGAILVDKYSYYVLFIIVGITHIIGALFLLVVLYMEFCKLTQKSKYNKKGFNNFRLKLQWFLKQKDPGELKTAKELIE